MVNPLLPLLELQDRHIKKCKRITAGDVGRAKRRKKKKKKKKEKELALDGSNIEIKVRVDGGSPVEYKLPVPQPSKRPGLRRLMQGSDGAGVSLEVMTELLRYDFTPPLIQKLTEAFQRADKNHDWSLEKKELVSFMEALYIATRTDLPKPHVLNHEVVVAFMTHDRDLNDRLDIIEIVDFIRTSNLVMSLKKKWRPRVGDDAELLRKEQENERLRKLRLEARKRKQIEAQRLAHLIERTTAIMTDEEDRRRHIPISEEYERLLIGLAKRECVIRYTMISMWWLNMVVLYSSHGIGLRKTLVGMYAARMDEMKDMFTRDSLKMVHAVLKTAAATGYVNREVEALFNAVGYKCSLNTLMHNIADSCDLGKGEEICAFLETFEGAAFSSNKWEALVDSFGGPLEVEALAIRLEMYYIEKFPTNLNVLGEIAENLSADLCDVVTLASALYRKHSKKYHNNSPSAILVMCLYTCEGEHIDKLLNLPKGTAPSIYKDINWALREGSKASNYEAQDMLRKWVGFIGVLSTTKVNSKHVWRGKTLYRGLMNLPKNVHDNYMGKMRGEVLYWPAATSASLSKELVLQEFTKEGTPVVFVIDGCQEGAEMWHVSMYAEEQEMLLPPFTVFVVTKVLPSLNRIHMRVLGSLGNGACEDTGFSEEVDADFGAWLKRVAQDGSHEAVATTILTLLTLQQEFEALPKVFFSNHSKLLMEELKAFKAILQNLQQTITTVYRPPPQVQAHLNSIWRHVDNVSYLTKITRCDFGVDFEALMDKAKKAKKSDDLNW